MTQQLSPIAHAVQFAAFRVYDEEELLYVVSAEKHAGMIAAASIRAAADQAHPKAHIEDIDYVHQSYVDGWKDALDVILAIADEFEAQ